MRRHGIYVWGDNWQKAKAQYVFTTMVDFVEYLFLKEKRFILGPSATITYFPLQSKCENVASSQTKIQTKFIRSKLK